VPFVLSACDKILSALRICIVAGQVRAKVVQRPREFAWYFAIRHQLQTQRSTVWATSVT
jgi:hypothetical protein